MRKHELRELHRQLTNEFRLQQNVTGLDLLNWYLHADTREAREIRKVDTPDDARASIRCCANAPFALMKREERAVDAVLSLLHERGLDVSRERARMEGRAASHYWVLSAFADAATQQAMPAMPEDASRDGWYRRAFQAGGFNMKVTGAQATLRRDTYRVREAA